MSSSLLDSFARTRTGSFSARRLKPPAGCGGQRPVRFQLSEWTSRRQRALFQRQEQFRDRLMLRSLREEAQPLAIDREVACFFAAGRKPVAIKVERGGLQIVGVADDAQHRAASARISPALICSPFVWIGWSVPTQRSTL